MSDVIVGAIVESAAAVVGAYSRERIDGRALIGYASILDQYDVAITATSEASGFAAVNVKSRLTHSGWQPASGSSSQYLYFIGSVGHPVDYLGIAAHTLASTGCTIDLSYSDDGGTTFTSVLTYAPTSDAPFMLTFTQTSRLYWRLCVIIPTATTPTISVVMLGERLALQRGIYVGHKPAPFSRSVVYNTTESEGGNFLGRSVVRKFNDTDITLKRITPTWYRAYLYPFETSAQENPFFFMWNTDDRYKGEVIYGFLTADPRPVNDHVSFMAVDYSVRGLA